MVKKNDDCDIQETKIIEHFLPNSIPFLVQLIIYIVGGIIVLFLLAKLVSIYENYFYRKRFNKTKL
jgi:hypothetical protein